MANIRKVFNFREGVQVDETTFVVNGSLVGIGTSLPTEFFDVRNTSSFSGFTTFSNGLFQSGISTFDNQVDIGRFRFDDGVIEATTGVVSFSGDGSALFNIPTSQWVDVDTGIAVSSIYNGGSVGIATTSPQYQLQVGDNPEGGGLSDKGFGVNYGDIYLTGIMTAAQFAGSGDLLTNLNASELSSGIVTQARIPRLELDKLPLVPDFKLVQDQQLTGVVTALGGFIGSVTHEPGRDAEARIFGNTFIEVGISTFFEGEFKGNLTATATTARGLTGTPDIRVGLLSATNADLGIGFTAQIGDIRGDFAVGVLTVRDDVPFTSVPFNVISGAAGAAQTSLFRVQNDGKIGIGTTNPSSNLSVEAATDARIEVRSYDGYAAINVGGDVGVGNSTVEFRYEDERLEINNFSSSDTILHHAKNNVGDGSFKIRRGNPLVEQFTITSLGDVGIGITNPTTKLDITGGLKADGDVDISGNTTVGGALTITGNVEFGATSGLITAFNLDVLNDVDIDGSVEIQGDTDIQGGITYNSTSGISTAFALDVNNTLEANGNIFANGGEQRFNAIKYFASGICTNQFLDVDGGLDVVGIVTISSDIRCFGGLTYNSTSGIATAFELDVLNDLGVTGVATFNDARLNTNCRINNITGIDTMSDLKLLSSLDITAFQDFNYFTNTGITTVNDFFILGQFDPLRGGTADFNVRSSSGVSTFNDLAVNGNQYITGNLDVIGNTYLQSVIALSQPVGITTIRQLIVACAGMSVSGVSTFFEKIQALSGIDIQDTGFTVNAPLGFATFFNADLQSDLNVGTNIVLGDESDETAPGAGATGTINANSTGITTYSNLKIGNNTEVVQVGAGLSVFTNAPSNYISANNIICPPGGLALGVGQAGDDGAGNPTDIEWKGVVDLSREDSGAFLPPVVTTATRDLNFGLEEGSVIHNETENTLQIYDGGNWCNLVRQVTGGPGQVGTGITCEVVGTNLNLYVAGIGSTSLTLA